MAPLDKGNLAYLRIHSTQENDKGEVDFLDSTFNVPSLVSEDLSNEEDPTGLERLAIVALESVGTRVVLVGSIEMDKRIARHEGGGREGACKEVEYALDSAGPRPYKGHKGRGTNGRGSARDHVHREVTKLERLGLILCWPKVSN